MIVGKVYEFKDKNKKFPFDFERGCFIGYTNDGWPRFCLNVRRGTQCFINAVDDTFEEVNFDKKVTLKDINPIKPQEANMI